MPFITNSYRPTFRNGRKSPCRLTPESIFQFTSKSLLQLYSLLLRISTDGNLLTIRCALYATKVFVKQTNTFYPTVLTALSRYTKRHNVRYFVYPGALDKQTKHAKFNSLLGSWRHWVEVIQPNFRPDLVIIQNHSVYVLEPTDCHETNLKKIVQIPNWKIQ